MVVAPILLCLTPIVRGYRVVNLGGRQKPVRPFGSVENEERFVERIMIQFTRAFVLAAVAAFAVTFAIPAQATLIYEDGVNNGPNGVVPDLVGAEVEDAIDENTAYLGQEVDFVGRVEQIEDDGFALETPDTEGFPTIIDDVGESITITCTQDKGETDECVAFDWDIVLKGAWEIVKIGIKSGGGSDAKGYWLLDPFASDDGSLPGFSVLSGSVGCLDYAALFDLEACTLTGRNGIKAISHIDFFGVKGQAPEPLTLGLLGLGLAGIGFGLRRRG
jgi:hypothetical protein